jgi:hypothetical protein
MVCELSLNHKYVLVLMLCGLDDSENVGKSTRNLCSVICAMKFLCSDSERKVADTTFEASHVLPMYSW